MVLAGSQFQLLNHKDNSMAQLIVRKLDKKIVDALKKRAAEHGRSAEAEHRTILAETLTPKPETFWRRAGELRKRLSGRDLGDSTEIIRAERDRRAGDGL